MNTPTHPRRRAARFAAFLLLFLSQPLLAYYCPATGRFLSRDPVGEQGGENTYAFVRNSPLDTVDYLGLAETTVPKAQPVEEALPQCGKYNIEGSVLSEVKFGLSWKNIGYFFMTGTDLYYENVLGNNWTAEVVPGGLRDLPKGAIPPKQPRKPKGGWNLPIDAEVTIKISGTNAGRIFGRKIISTWRARTRGGFNASATSPHGDALSTVELKYSGSGKITFANNAGQTSSGKGSKSGLRRYGFLAGKRYSKCCHVPITAIGHAEGPVPFHPQRAKSDYKLSLDFIFYKEDPK